MTDPTHDTPPVHAAAGDGAGHGHGHDPHLAHHFDTREQQFSAAKLGMWLFLAQEILFFGGLFCAYSVYRAIHPEMYRFATQELDKVMGAINTVVLLVSSLTMAMAVRTCQLRQKTTTLVYLLLTFVCASTFMVIKYFEYGHKIENHTVMAGMVGSGDTRMFFGARGFSYDPYKEHDASQAAE